MTALLALLAIVVPASVALVGHWFAQQSARRLAQEREQNDSRLAQHEVEERARLRLDAAMRAGTLFGAGGEAQPSSAASASGLLALTQLDHADLAVALLVDLWSVGSASAAQQDVDVTSIGVESARPTLVPTVGGQGPGLAAHAGATTRPLGTDGTIVSTETALLVINAALCAASSPNAQLMAAELLCRNSYRLDPCQSLHWPAAIDGRWLPDLPPRAKLLLLDGLVRMTSTSRANENALRSIAVRLYGVWLGDPDPRVKGCVGTLLGSLMPALKQLTYSDFMQGRELVSIAALEKAAEGATSNPDGFLKKLVEDRGKTLSEWSKGCGSCNFSPGMLSTAAE